MRQPGGGGWGRTSDGASFRHAGANELQNSPHKPAPTGLEARRWSQLADGEGCGRRTLREGPRCKHYCWLQRRRRNRRREWPQSSRQRSVSCKLAVCDMVGSALVASQRTATDAHLVSAAHPPTLRRPTSTACQATHPPTRHVLVPHPRHTAATRRSHEFSLLGAVVSVFRQYIRVTSNEACNGSREACHCCAGARLWRRRQLLRKRQRRVRRRRGGRRRVRGGRGRRSSSGRQSGDGGDGCSGGMLERPRRHLLLLLLLLLLWQRPSTEQPTVTHFISV